MFTDEDPNDHRYTSGPVPLYPLSPESEALAQAQADLAPDLAPDQLAILSGIFGLTPVERDEYPIKSACAYQDFHDEAGGFRHGTGRHST